MDVHVPAKGAQHAVIGLPNPKLVADCFQEGEVGVFVYAISHD